MAVLEAWKTRGSVALIIVIGVLLTALHLVHALGEGEDLVTFVSGILVPLVVSLGIIIGGGSLWRREIAGEHAFRIASWCVTGGVVLGLMSGLSFIYQRAEGVVMSDPGFVIVGSITIGSGVGLLVGMYDVRQRRSRRETERLRRQLTVLNRLVRHDIRNGATVIHGNAVLLAEAGVNATQVAEIQQAADELVALGERAKTVERMVHADEPEPEFIEIVAVIERVVERARETHPTATIDVELPDIRLVKAHPLVETALSNVIENAIVHNESESPTVEIRLDASQIDGTEYVDVRVADDGPGIPEEEVAVFSRGYETDLEHASGLGLWVTEWVVTASGGALQFEESDLGGTAAVLRLPDAESVPADQAIDVGSDSLEATH